MAKKRDDTHFSKLVLYLYYNVYYTCTLKYRRKYTVKIPLCINYLEQILQIEGQFILSVRTVKKSESFRTAKYQEFRSLSSQMQVFLIEK